MALVLTVLAAFSWDGCTAASLGNAPLAHWEPEPARASPEDSRATRSDELLLILAFSGGGTRAAAFAYGILEELAATPVVLGGQSRRLLDEVDLISSVSGGSFTAAYYGLYGDRIFRDFETDFLRRPVERELFLQLLRPYNWVRLASPYFNRSRIAAEYYDEHLFRGATFADLERQPGRDHDERDGSVDRKPVRVQSVLLRSHLLGPVALSRRAGGDRIVGGARPA